MKTKLTLLVLSFFTCVAMGYGQVPTWMLTTFGRGGTYSRSSSDGSFVFPQWKRNQVAFPAFLSTTTDSSVLGNLSGKTISATVTITATPNAVFVFGGELPRWNTGPFPASGRLWFSTTAQTYDVQDGIDNEHKYWWSRHSQFICTNNLGTVTISDSFDPSHWTSANGRPGNDPLFIDKFNAAVSNVRQIGVSFGGGCCFDIGVGLKPQSGSSASFRLNAFNVQ